MEKVTIRPLMTIPKDKHDFLVSSASEMGVSFNQYAALCLMTGVRAMERAAQTEGTYTPAEFAGFLKALGIGPKFSEAMQADAVAQGMVEKPKPKSRAKKIA